MKLFLKITFIVLLVVLIFVLAFNGFVYVFQDSLIFETNKIEPKDDINIADNYEIVYIQTEDEYKHKCWYIKADGDEKKPVILYFLGNGSLAERNVELFNSMIKNLNVDIFTCTNRGSGFNEGKITEENLYKDGELYFKYLKERKPPHIFVFGSSMGGALAIELANKKMEELSGLIIENTFLSIKKYVKRKYFIIYYLIFNFDFMVRTKMDNELKIKRINIPSFFAISEKDTTINPIHTKTLAAQSPSIYKITYLSENGTHKIIPEKKYHEEIKKFMNEAMKIKKKKKITN